MTAPLRVYGSALRAAAQGRDGSIRVLTDGGALVRRIDPRDWAAALAPGDRSLVSRCAGPVLDVGCGPGRLTVALLQAGQVALGVDVSAEAVRQALTRGAPAIRADVFDPIPDEGRWRSILLADGNIGIGGDPVALLRRCTALLSARGMVLAELAAPGDRSWTGYVRLQYAGRCSAPFPWASVSAGDIVAVAGSAGLRVDDVWSEARRWFALLGR